MTLEEWMLEQPVIAVAMDEVVAMATSIIYTRMTDSEIDKNVIASKINNQMMSMTIQITNVRH